YSAMVKQNLKKLGLEFNARIDISIIEDYYSRQNSPIKFTKAFEFSFNNPSSPGEKRIFENIQKRRTDLMAKISADLKAQEERLSAAEMKFKSKPTKAIEKELGVAQRQI